MGRKKINPPRRRTKEQERMDYRKQLATRQVTSTAETTTKTPLVEELNGTDKIPPIEQAPIPLTRETVTPSQKLSKMYTIIWVTISVLIFIGTIVYHYASLKEGLSYTKASLTELKQTLDKRIDRLEERIDKYISREKTK